MIWKFVLIQLEELAILPNNCEISSDKIVFQKVQIIMLLYPNVEWLQVQGILGLEAISNLKLWVV